MRHGFIRNPLAEVAPRASPDGKTMLDVAALSTVRGVLASNLLQGASGSYEAALLLAGRDDDAVDLIAGLSTPAIFALWSAGVIVNAQECPDPGKPAFSLWAPGLAILPTGPRAIAAEIAGFAERGYVDLPDCITPAATAALHAYYAALIGHGLLRRGDNQADRYKAHNDLAGRRVQRALAPLVAQIVGRPIKPSYCYASLYCGGASLAMHRDRPQCQYTVSLLFDYQPLAPAGLSPWPLTLQPVPEGAPIDCFQAIGGGLLFKGQEIAHGRPALPDGDACWVLLLHYVDAGFSGRLD